MQAAEPGEFRLRKPGDGAKTRAAARHASAWSGNRPCCRACRACCPGAAARWHRLFTVGSCGLVSPTGFHRPIAQGFRGPRLGHHLDRQAAIEIGRIGFPLLEVGLLAGNQRVDETVILLFGQGTIDVVGAGTAGAEPCHSVTETTPADMSMEITVHDRGDGIEERQRVLIGLVRGWRWRAGADVSGPVAIMTLPQSAGGQAADFRRDECRSGGWSCRGCGDGGGKSVAIDSPRRHRRETWLASAAAHDQRAQPAHFGVQQARTALLAASSERNELEHTSFGKAIGAMGPRSSGRAASRAGRRGRLPGQPARQLPKPARPAPTIWTVFRERFDASHGTGVSAFFRRSGNRVRRAYMVWRIR